MPFPVVGCMSESRRERQARLAGVFAGPLLLVGGVLLVLNDNQNELGLTLVAAAAVVMLASAVVRAWLRPSRHEG